MGMLMSKKQESDVSPKGKAVWAFLTEPNKKWKPEYGEYTVTLVMEPGKTSAAFIAKLEAIRDEYYETLLSELPAAKAKKLSKRPVYEDNLDAADEETGMFNFKFASNAGGVTKAGKAWEFAPRLYDSGAILIKGKINIGNGSILQVSYTPAAYVLNTDYSVGCKMYVNDVMIHKLVKYSGTDPGFKASKDSNGFTYEDGTEANKAPGFTPDNAPDGVGESAGTNVDF